MEHPIVFSSEMVRAILDGRKTQTRRVIKPQPESERGIEQCADGKWVIDGNYHLGSVPVVESIGKCPYGQPGDTLWVREPWAVVSYTHSEDGWECDGIRSELDVPKQRPPDSRWERFGLVYATDYEAEKECGEKWRPSIHMPRWVSRLTLEIVRVRVERLQDISEQDALAEGATNELDLVWQTGDDTPVGIFGEYWDSINAKRGYPWDSNPWVFAIEFRKL